MEYIDKITYENTGGGCMVDFIHLKDGRVIGLNDECVVLYQSMEDFYTCETKSRQCIDLYNEEPRSWK